MCEPARRSMLYSRKLVERTPSPGLITYICLITFSGVHRPSLRCVQSVQLILDQLLLKRTGVNHTILPPQGAGGSDQTWCRGSFWMLNTGF